MEDFRKLFLRRQKRGRIVDGHGAFIPEHIHAKGTEVLAISPLEGQPKFSRLDAANDVATLFNALSLGDAEESMELFLKRYVSSTKDRDLAHFLPAYRTFQALRSGVMLSEWLTERKEMEQPLEDLQERAEACYKLAARVVRTLPRPE